MQRATPVPVAGLGCLCAAGATLPQCLIALDAGVRAPKPLERFARVQSPRPVFALPADFFVRPPEEEGLTHSVRMALTAAREALADAGIDQDELAGLRVGVCLGTSVGASLNFLDYYAEVRAGQHGDPMDLRRFAAGNPAPAVARTLGLSGPVQTVTNACSSGADAIGIAASWIREGLCDIALAGGVDELSPVTLTGFSRLMITDSEACRPFDARRNGLNLGEGAAMLVLDGRPGTPETTMHGHVLGYGTAGDAHHLTAPHPEGRGLKAALADAMTQAECKAADVAFINAHGTGTRNNDQVEGLVARTLFPGVPVLSTKGMTGHTLGAAGAIEAAFTLAHLQRGTIPMSAGFAEPDPEVGISPPTKATPVRGLVALSQSLAFGGNNSVLVLGGNVS